MQGARIVSYGRLLVNNFNMRKNWGLGEALSLNFIRMEWLNQYFTNKVGNFLKIF